MVRAAANENIQTIELALHGVEQCARHARHQLRDAHTGPAPFIDDGDRVVADLRQHVANLERALACVRANIQFLAHHNPALPMLNVARDHQQLPGAS